MLLISMRYLFKCPNYLRNIHDRPLPISATSPFSAIFFFQLIRSYQSQFVLELCQIWRRSVIILFICQETITGAIVGIPVLFFTQVCLFSVSLHQYIQLISVSSFLACYFWSVN